MCFKLELLKRGGYNMAFDAAADQRRIVSNTATIDGLAEIDGAVQQQQRLVQAAAAAVKQIPARVPDLSTGSSAPGSSGGGDAAVLQDATGGGSDGCDAAGTAADEAGAEPASSTAAGDAAAGSDGGACVATCSRFAADTLAAATPKGVSTSVKRTAP
jgi:hypothetical protein